MTAFTGLATISSMVLSLGLALAPSAARGAETKEWALLTFLNGFNDLDPYGVRDMNEMEKVGSSDRVHVVVQWASLATKQVKRVYVEKDEKPRVVTSPVLENLGQADMGDYRNLVEFVKWAVRRYPAKRYFVNVWNHGNGWHRAAGAPPTSRDVSHDELSGNRITTEQLGLAAAEISRELGRKIDIMASDSCLMAMAEVVGQMRDDVDHFIGSEEVEPADGWPYQAFLEGWNHGGEKSPVDLARLLTRVYRESYPKGRRITLSGLDMAAYPELTARLRDLAEAIRSQDGESRRRILEIVRETQAFEHEDYKDLGDFVDRLGKAKDSGIPSELLLGVKTALRRLVVANETSPDYARSQGVAVWLPDTKGQLATHRKRYRELAFNRETQWLEAIESTVPMDGDFRTQRAP